jgi:hypothetical protein
VTHQYLKFDVVQQIIVIDGCSFVVPAPHGPHLFGCPRSVNEDPDSGAWKLTKIILSMFFM